MTNRSVHAIEAGKPEEVAEWVEEILRSIPGIIDDYNITVLGEWNDGYDVIMVVEEIVPEAASDLPEDPGGRMG